MIAKTKDKSTAPRKRRAHEYLVDGKGKRVAIVLPIEEYEELIEAIEQHYDALALAEAVAEGGEAKPWEQVKAELRAEGNLP
jgi:hypothetical protein